MQSGSKQLMHHLGGARLVEFSFTSILAAGLDEDELLRLARQSWTANRRAGVTGRLRLDGRRVDQMLEGPGPAMLALSARILTDRRHAGIRVRALGAAPGRRFADWTLEGLDPPAEPPCAAAQGAGRVLRLLPAAEPPAAWMPAPPLAALGSA